MKTLHLNLIAKWYYMTFAKIKPEEYRSITPYWCSRLLIVLGESKPLKFWKEHKEIHKEKFIDWVVGMINNGNITLKKYETITFSNGYSKKRPQFEIEHLRIEIRGGLKEWGAEEWIKYFVLIHGEIIERGNIK